MRDGSFDSQMTGLDFETEIDVRNIKTPDQMPDPVDLAQVPENILRSGVIESLINQNDDLMSRLNVSLRRVAHLEEKISDARNESAQYKAKYDNLNDQVLVLREQSRIVAERTRHTEEKNKREEQSFDDLKDQIQVLEIRYAELYTSTQERQEKHKTELEKNIIDSQNKNAQLLAEIEILKDSSFKFSSRHTKYRKNIRRAIAATKEELQTLRARRQGQETLLNDLRKNISETTSYIAEQSKEHKSQILSLTEAYEGQLREMKSEIEKQAEQNRSLEERSIGFEKNLNDKVKLENALIIAERRQEELQMQTAVEISDIQKTLVRYRNDAKDLAIELDARNHELTEKTTSLEQLAEDKQGLTEQVETLQLLWRDQQNQVEKINDQKNSLQKLNQELSITINEYRREIRELKERLDATELKSISFKNEVEKKDKMRAELNKKIVVQVEAKLPEVKREDTLTPEIISKIDKVLSSLHGGN